MSEPAFCLSQEHMWVDEGKNPFYAGLFPQKLLCAVLSWYKQAFVTNYELSDEANRAMIPRVLIVLQTDTASWPANHANRQKLEYSRGR